MSTRRACAALVVAGSAVLGACSSGSEPTSTTSTPTAETAIEASSTAPDTTAADALDTTAAVAVLTEILEQGAAEGRDGGDDLTGPGGCPLEGSFTSTDEWAAEAGGSIFCLIDGDKVLAVTLGQLPMGELFPDGGETFDEAPAHGGTFTTVCPPSESSTSAVTGLSGGCAAVWTNGDITVAIISQTADDAGDPRAVLEASVVQVLASVASFDPASQLDPAGGD